MPTIPYHTYHTLPRFRHRAWMTPSKLTYKLVGAGKHVRLLGQDYPSWSQWYWKVSTKYVLSTLSCSSARTSHLMNLSYRSCLLHRFLKNEWRLLSSQTIGVEFASKIIKVGTGTRRKRIKLQVRSPASLAAKGSLFRGATKSKSDSAQLWDTAGTERFRSVSRSYYRGAAGAILVYDITSHASFRGLQPFLNDARALASPNLSLMLVGNKLDLASDSLLDLNVPSTTPSSVGSTSTITAGGASSFSTMGTYTAGSFANWERGGSIGAGMQQRATLAPEGREISTSEVTRWASSAGISVVTEVSALNGEGVDEIFNRLARMILTKIELGDIDPDDPMSGIQYGDGGVWNTASDGGSIKSSMTGPTNDDGMGGPRRRRRGKNRNQNWGLREWEEVFTLSSRSSRRGGGCC